MLCPVAANAGRGSKHVHIHMEVIPAVGLLALGPSNRKYVVDIYMGHGFHRG